MPDTYITLSDEDMATLINSADPKVRTAAEAAASRLAAPGRWPDLPVHIAALVTDVVAEAKTAGRLLCRHESVSYCRYCDAKSTWVKPKRRRNMVEARISGVEFADRFLIIKGSISVGACRACVDHALPTLRSELARFPVQLPTPLRLDGAPTYMRWDLTGCKKCEWSGHEGQLGKLPAIFGGEYPGRCPSCGAERRAFGPDPFERREGFEVVEVTP